MTDEELIARLQYWVGTNSPISGTVLGEYCKSAADRIEALVKEKDKFQDYLQKTHVDWEEAVSRAERLEAALENLTIAIGMGWDLDGVLDVARAELKGEEP
jgi:hypothetical protein